MTTDPKRLYQNRKKHGTRRARQLAFAFLAPGHLGIQFKNSAGAAPAVSPPADSTPRKQKSADGAPGGFSKRK